MPNDWLNPIFVYEIRQVVRNRSILLALCVYLALMVGVTVHHFLDILQAGEWVGYDGRDGVKLIRKLIPLLGLYSLGTVSLYSVSMTVRQGFEEELLYQTRIDWFRTACGKIQVAALLTALFYAVTMPLLVLGWLLRGVDLLQLLNLLAVMFALTQCLNYYLTAAVIRCGNWTDVTVAALGMIPALPLWMFIGGNLLAVAVGMSGLIAPSRGDWLQFYFWTVLFLTVITLFSSEMFKTNWRHRTLLHRFSRVATGIWFSALLTVIFGGLMSLFFIIVWSIVRAVSGILIP